MPSYSKCKDITSDLQRKSISPLPRHSGGVHQQSTQMCFSSHLHILTSNASFPNTVQPYRLCCLSGENNAKSGRGHKTYAGLLVSNKVRRIWITLTMADSFFSWSKMLDSSCSTVSCLVGDKEHIHSTSATTFSLCVCVTVW